MNEERKKQKQVFSELKTIYYKQRESDLQLLEEFKALEEEFKQTRNIIIEEIPNGIRTRHVGRKE